MVTDNKGEEWLTPKEAAIELGLSVSRIYQLVNDLPHKKGGNKRGRVFFLRKTLFENYLNIKKHGGICDTDRGCEDTTPVSFETNAPET